MNIQASSRGLGGSRNIDNPLMNKGLRANMLNASKNKAKREAEQRYKELIQNGWSANEAKRNAYRDYQ